MKTFVETTGQTTGHRVCQCV